MLSVEFLVQPYTQSVRMCKFVQSGRSAVTRGDLQVKRGDNGDVPAIIVPHTADDVHHLVDFLVRLEDSCIMAAANLLHFICADFPAGGQPRFAEFLIYDCLDLFLGVFLFIAHGL